MSHEGWRVPLRSLDERRIDEAVFFNRCVGLRHAGIRDGKTQARANVPRSAQSVLCHVAVDCSNPTPRTLVSLLEAAAARLCTSAELALARYEDDRPSGKLI